MGYKAVAPVAGMWQVSVAKVGLALAFQRPLRWPIIPPDISGPDAMATIVRQAREPALQSLARGVSAENRIGCGKGARRNGLAAPGLPIPIVRRKIGRCGAACCLIIAVERMFNIR